MSGKWTPGPWGLDRDEEEGGIAILNASGAQLGILHGEGEQVSDDAHLIATSPELAEALEAMIERFGHDIFTMTPEDRELLTRAAAALAKAKGEGA